MVAKGDVGLVLAGYVRIAIYLVFIMVMKEHHLHGVFLAGYKVIVMVRKEHNLLDFSWLVMKGSLFTWS